MSGRYNTVDDEDKRKTTEQMNKFLRKKEAEKLRAEFDTIDY